MTPDRTTLPSTFAPRRNLQPHVNPRPPGAGLLSCATATVPTVKSQPPASMATLPTMLIYKIKSWLIKEDGLQLFMTDHYMNLHLQEFHRLRLIPPVVDCSVGPLPNDDGALLNPVFRSMLLAEENPNRLENITTDIAFALGGKLMSDANRDALLAFILDSCKTSCQPRMAAMITGLCNALGAWSRHHEAMLEQILAFCKTGTPGQLGEMIIGLCFGLGGEKMEKRIRTRVIDRVLAMQKTSSGLQIFSMLHAACVGLGGVSITPEKRDQLLQQILLFQQAHPQQPLEPLLLALYGGLGGAHMTVVNRNALLDKILAGCKPSTPGQMRIMIEALCTALGGKNMPATIRASVINKILGAHKTVTPSQMAILIYRVCLVLGGATMTPEHRDAVLVQLLDWYDANAVPPLEQVLAMLCTGLSHQYQSNLQVSRDVMTVAHLDAVLAQILRRLPVWTNHQITEAVATLCNCLGGISMSPVHRDRILTTVLNSYATCTPLKMGAMIWGLCFNVFGGMDTTAITPENKNRMLKNFNAILSQILDSHKTSSPLQIGMMVYSLFIALRRTRLMPVHRLALVARIKETGRVQEIVLALKLGEHGRQLLQFLQLDTASTK